MVRIVRFLLVLICVALAGCAAKHFEAQVRESDPIQVSRCGGDQMALAVCVNRHLISMAAKNSFDTVPRLSETGRSVISINAKAKNTRAVNPDQQSISWLGPPGEDILVREISFAEVGPDQTRVEFRSGWTWDRLEEDIQQAIFKCGAQCVRIPEAEKIRRRDDEPKRGRSTTYGR